MSKWLQVKTVQNGKFEKLTFKDGILENREYGQTDELDGMITMYQPDGQFFDHTGIDETRFFALCHDLSCLCPKITIKYSDKETGENREFNSPKGIESLLDNLESKEIIKNRINIRFAQEKRELLMSITYTEAYSGTIVPYVNYGLTESGTHITAVKNILTREFNKFAKDRRILGENEKNLSGDQIQEGMYCVFNLISPNVKYDAQVKSRITSSDLSPFLNEAITNTLQLWFANNYNDAKKIIDKAIMARKAAEAARKARDGVREKKDKNIIKVVTDKLSDCISKVPEECEVYLVEGDSAGGSAKTARNRQTQAVLSLRGKILNVEKAAIDKINANNEIQLMIRSFNCGIGETFNEEKLRYHKIIIMTDADVDGAHISTLLLTFLYRFMPELIRGGYVYQSVPPLYKVIRGSKSEYLLDDAALEEYRRTHSERFELQRFKGLGEMDADQLWDTTMNPETRLLKKITMEQAKEEIDKTFETLMGTEVEPRRKFIEENATYADIDV